MRAGEERRQQGASDAPSVRVRPGYVSSLADAPIGRGLPEVVVVEARRMMQGA